MSEQVRTTIVGILAAAIAAALQQIWVVAPEHDTRIANRDALFVCLDALREHQEWHE